jgi:hypothetical protein
MHGVELAGGTAANLLQLFSQYSQRQLLNSTWSNRLLLSSLQDVELVAEDEQFEFLFGGDKRPICIRSRSVAKM